MTLFAGCDWGGEVHAVCVVDETGTVRLKFTTTHNAEGLDKLVRQLAKLGPPADLAIAIERPTGLLVDTLVAAGHPVVPLHPNIVKACRPRYRAAGGKSDLGDSYLIADVLRTDGHRFARLHPQSDAMKALRALVRTRDDLVAERVALANQLRAPAELLARRRRDLRRHRLADCAGVRPVLPNSRQRLSSRREAPRHLPHAALVLRPA